MCVFDKVSNVFPVS